jgi:hypothetical protein
MFFSGAPAKRSLKTSVQFTANPQLAGRSGAISTLQPPRISVQLPVEPSRGQLAPPSARIVAADSTCSRLPSSKRNRRRPAASQPSQSRRVRNWTPCGPDGAARRARAARLSALWGRRGRWTRQRWAGPDLPPSAESGGWKGPDRRRQTGLGRSVTVEEPGQALRMGEVQATAPGHEELCARMSACGH